MNKSDFDKISPSLPKQPGVYQFLGLEDEILYVGKAKNLKNRLTSYFTGGKSRTYKTRMLVKNAVDLHFTIVESEQDALLLENSLIKKHQPRYNVTWRDDKTYTYICVKKERFPRVFFTRRILKDGSTYFGPYASKWKARVVLDLIRSVFPLRTCNLPLAQEHIDGGKYKVCLEYHIKNCEGPCVGLEAEKDYDEKIDHVKKMLRGHLGEVKRWLKDDMREASEDLNFERAQTLKDKIDIIDAYQSKSTVVSIHIKDLDVFSIATDEKFAYVNYLKVVDGTIVYAHTLELTKNLNEDKKDLLRYAIPIFRTQFQSVSHEIVLPFDMEIPEIEASITVPQRGEKKHLVDLSLKNVKYFIKQKEKEAAERKRKQTSAQRILTTLQQDLQMDVLPMHIECFDNSNMQGSYPVAACVVFKNAKPDKKSYRHFHIKTVEGPNDFASMEEVVYRRYRRLIKEEAPLPELIIIDGGKGQLSAAMKSIDKLGIQDQVSVIGIAKRLEEIYMPGDSVPLYINKKSESLKLIQQLRNEAHRFAITFHRNVRSKNFTVSSLTDIQGVGEKTAQKLITHFKSVKNIRDASRETLVDIVGPSVADKVLQHYNQDTDAAISEKG